ncbi:MAG: sodium-dependent transporter [Ruminococcaceae bacterium]|nr:sodium-dependent transporter [Oscillospiraceae bacterium]
MSSKTAASKGGFSSKVGFILAAAGSAVGLGNIWRFPYLAAQYGGGMFLLTYLILSVTFGFALLVTEIALGRKTGKSVIGAYSTACSKFKPLGWVASLVPCIIFPYYCVIGGWVFKYLTMYMSGGSAQLASEGFFSGYISSAGEPMLFLAVYMGLTALVVMLGVEKGIEKFSKVLMPVLVIISLGVGIYVLTLDGAMDGFMYYVTPNFENFSVMTIVAAMGQLFYSMSIAMGIMVTYGSYMRKTDSIETSVHYIEIFDTGVAFLAGMMIIPPVFAFNGGDPEKLGQGPGLMFDTLPKVFEAISPDFGWIVGLVFFLLVSLAALTSSISLMETIVSIIVEKFKLKRMHACLVVIGFSFVIGLLSVFGSSIWADVKIMDRQFLDFFDFISNNIIMPLVALFTCILIGYVVKTKYVEDEVEIGTKFRMKKLYRIMVKFVCPVFMLVIFFSSLFITI